MNEFRFRRFNFRNDIVEVFNLMMDPQDQMLFSNKVVINTLPDFDSWMQANFKGYYHEFYVVTGKEEWDIIGIVYSYDYRPFDLNCKLCTIVRKDLRNTGIGAAISIQFLNELFTTYPMHKVFLTIYDYNDQSLQSNIQAGFVEEGCFKEYRYYDGRFYDMHILGLTRDEFYEKFSNFLRRNA